MVELSETNPRVSIEKEFFCDGHCYVLTSQSLGGSGVTPAELSEILFEGDDEKTAELLKKGVCLPVCFDGDCALDGNTVFVLGDLSEQEERDWIARLAWKLNVPCGKMILCCGCSDDDLEHAVSGAPPDEHYVFFQTIEVPPAEYLVEIYAYFSSQTVQVSLTKYDESGRYYEDAAQEAWYRENRPGVEGVGYVIRLKPLETEPVMPALVQGWLGKFVFR
jgi:hypothetical protein